jgi:hypothetical protein
MITLPYRPVSSVKPGAVSAAPGVVGLSLDLDHLGATCLSKAVEQLVKPKYAADANASANPEKKISRLAASVSRLASNWADLGVMSVFTLPLKKSSACEDMRLEHPPCCAHRLWK